MEAYLDNSATTCLCPTAKEKTVEAINKFYGNPSSLHSIGTAAWFSVVFMLAIAGVWEIAEWAYAEIDGGDAGQAFLGSQGDIWDAQKDMLLDTLGAALAALIFYVQQRRSAHMR